MCGIAGATGFDNVVPRVYRGIRALEYRGYDSCGIAVAMDGAIHFRKDVGGVEEVAQKERFLDLSGEVAISHTRWATHGGVTRANAHPHLSMKGDFAVVHNGIFDNYRELRARLQAEGCEFKSQTDTEVFAHLIASYFAKSGGDVLGAFVTALGELQGSYALAVISTHIPGTILCSKHKAPLSIGLGEDGNYIGSDSTAFIERTKRAIMLEDDDVAVITADDYYLKSRAGAVIVRKPITLQWDPEQAKKGGYPHYMLKEIHEQPQSVRAALGAETTRVDAVAELLGSAKHIYLAGVGTTHYVCSAAQYLLSQLAGYQATCISTDEFRYLARPEPGDVILTVSQSGETYDTLDAVRYAKECGARAACVVNVMGSSLERLADVAVLQMSGPEISVISTKAAMAQLVVLMRIALSIARKSSKLKGQRGQAPPDLDAVMRSLTELPERIERFINERSGFLKTLAGRHKDVDHWMFLGRGIYASIASECALKMKEVSYIHAEGMPAGFLKHGTLALIDDAVRSLMFIPPKADKKLYDLTQSAAHEIRARGGKIVAFAFEEDASFDDTIVLPEACVFTAPLMELVAGQLFSYFTALALNRSIDKPRSLAKSVTVP